MDILSHIKQLVIRGQYLFTFKADAELYANGLDQADAIESIINAKRIEKTLASRNPHNGKREKLYVIKGKTFSNIVLYTKGKIAKSDHKEMLYILISAKRST